MVIIFLLQFSTGYYQYNIAKNFRGAIKILEAMGYEVLHSEKLVKDEEPTKVHLTNPQKLFNQEHKVKLAKVLVNLILFEIELDTLAKCIDECKFECTIMDALKARRNTSGGVNEAVGYLYNHSKKESMSINTKSSSSSGNMGDNKAPLSKVGTNKAPSNNISTINKPTNNMHANMHGKNLPSYNTPANNATEQPIDLSVLPPPDYGEGDGFESVTQHINPSSHIDDDDTQIIKDSTQLGYRNPPEAKSQVMPHRLQFRPDPVGYYHGDHRPLDYHGDHRLPDWPQPTSMPLQTSPNRGGRFDKTHFELSGQEQHQHIDTRGLQRNEFQNGNIRPPNMAPPVVLQDDDGKTRSLHSLPSAPSGNADLIKSSPHVFKRQISIPSETSLTGGSERMAPIATDTTKNSNRLAVADSNAVLVAPVPLIDNPMPEASQAPPDSKYGRTNLNDLRSRFKLRKEVTQTFVQTGVGSHSQAAGGVGSHPQATDNYANAEIPFQGVSDTTNKPVPGKTDLTSLRNRLEKTKEEREKTMIGDKVNEKDKDYYNVSELPHYMVKNPVIMYNPASKKPLAAPRTVIPARQASNDTGISTASSKRLWQCAHCQTVNGAHHTSCEKCKLPCGKMADRSSFCEFCQLMIFIPLNEDFKDTCCPRCKQVHESVL